MSITDELKKLGELHQSGVLTDEEFKQAKARVIGGAGTSSGSDTPGLSAINALRRSRDDRWLGGVCGGIARITGVAAWAWRLMFALLLLCAGSGVVLYLLLWILLPEDETRHWPSGQNETA